MFEENITRETVRVFNELGGKLEGVIVPSTEKINQMIRELKKNFFNSNVQFPYAKRVLLGYEYSKNHYHSRTGKLLLEDIKGNKRIFINSYYEKNKKELGENDKNE
ncbi:hypothetical protein K7185_13460 [Clostridium butyricum]|uniref:hypothetical protein n=1 Tax=Clostridium butyricum TaxID=1492 RepID=UPI001CA87E2F|nr:hypothetical protein [Clostridium butyricum]MBZ0313477.1 hypothetical protein [Clostridium butyricum]